MPVTAKDIARELNLSQPTVSRILNGDEKHRASEETRRRVLETAQQMGYRPNALAASLRRGRTGIIGLHTSHFYDARNDFFGSIIAGLQHACNARGLDLLLHSTLQGRPPDEMFNRLRDGRIDGLILHSGADDPLVALLAESSLPVVSVADIHRGMAGVTCDDETGMKLLIEHLWSRGHHHFVYLAPERFLPSVEARRAVFESELKKRKVPKASRSIYRIHYEETAPFFGQWNGERVAVCCWNDRTAYNLLHDCTRRKIAVPKSLAVAGFDGFLDDKMPSRQLTTVGCPWADAAAKALEVLVALIEKNEQQDAPQKTLMPVCLHEGDTA
jgi:LacI family transcriptional regulator